MGTEALLPTKRGYHAASLVMEEASSVPIVLCVIICEETMENYVSK